MNTEAMFALARGLATAKSRQDVPAALTFMHSEMLLTSPFGSAASGLDENERALRRFFTSFPDYEVTLEDRRRARQLGAVPDGRSAGWYDQNSSKGRAAGAAAVVGRRPGLQSPDTPPRSDHDLALSSRPRPWRDGPVCDAGRGVSPRCRGRSRQLTPPSEMWQLSCARSYRELSLRVNA
jgi:hypothetical protein